MVSVVVLDSVVVVNVVVLVRVVELLSLVVVRVVLLVAVAVVNDVVLVAVKQNGYSLRYAKKKQRHDLALATAAVDQNGLAMCHAGMELRAVSLYAPF